MSVDALCCPRRQTCLLAVLVRLFTRPVVVAVITLESKTEIRPSAGIPDPAKPQIDTPAEPESDRCSSEASSSGHSHFLSPSTESEKSGFEADRLLPARNSFRPPPQQPPFLPGPHDFGFPPPGLRQFPMSFGNFLTRPELAMLPHYLPNPHLPYHLLPGPASFMPRFPLELGGGGFGLHPSMQFPIEDDGIVDDPKAELDDRHLWDSFSEWINEMIITKSGRWVLSF